MDALRLGRVGADHHEVVVAPQLLRRNPSTENQRRLPDIAVEARQRDDGIVDETIRRHRRDHVANVGDAVQDQLRLFGQVVAKSAAEIHLDRKHPLGVGVDGVEVGRGLRSTAYWVFARAIALPARRLGLAAPTRLQRAAITMDE